MKSFPLDRIAQGLPARQLIPTMTGWWRDESVTRAVVEAPPGSGKTTVIPPLMAELAARPAGSDGAPKKVLVTQPRRIAARSAAHRLAQLSGTAPGELSGYTIRGERKHSASTRVEFVTTGVLLRRLIRNPELEDVACIVLDEVHERHLDSDLAVGMVTQLAQMRDDLSVVAMSATLDARRWADLLGSEDQPARIASAEVRTHELTESWAPSSEPALDIRGVTPGFLTHVAETTAFHLGSTDGDLLLFLPGSREIDKVTALLRQRVPDDVEVLRLTGRTPSAEQQRIMSEAGFGTRPRRIIVSTNVAESAITVPGVRLVVDAGLDRQQRFDTVRGMSGLVTVGASKDSMVQRGGRAAREAPGTVVRCMSPAEFSARPASAPPEIATSDLTSAALDLACWGAPGGRGLRLPDPLPERAYARARKLLQALGAMDDDEQATATGRRLAEVPTDPRLARALFDGADMVGARASAEVLATIGSDDRAPGADLWASVRSFQCSGSGSWRREVDKLMDEVEAQPTGERATEESTAWVTALAFPDRIARRRGGSDEYLMTSGHGAALPPGSGLTGQEWLAVAEVALVNGSPVIRAAAVLDEETAMLAGSEMLREEEVATFSETRGGGRIISRTVAALGAIELSSTPRPPSPEAGRRAVRDAIRRTGFERFLAPSPAFESLRARMGLLHAIYGDPWPRVDLETLASSADSWLGQALDRIAAGAAPASTDTVSALRGLLPWPEASRMDDLVPERLTVPSGASVRLNYPAPEEHDPDISPPVLAVKLQECFGWASGPTICDGRVPVVLHLLSPARRPLAVTQDLTNFWTNVYPQVRAENRGRYIKHPWPEDPWNATATAKTKRASGG
ncbi:ATP-dependent helicase HrpB [Kocuria sp. HSID16901]|uniref:ATP-dependent helicase HrpB n=1 Tax=Kocuria sp. HSID16901 TaxID=2419505 RepID=UPI000F876EFC|nr:ATP-dependent helicase HrpB [Kocuria sp. HSID16901]MCT1368104.1 ATP-dependent helicase HrpB [Rothia sp. p3-SID1597]RUQ23172.1 ATP-dependent helicase HrpB [Kocuria sp. HSID16901]